MKNQKFKECRECKQSFLEYQYNEYCPLCGESIYSLTIIMTSFLKYLVRILGLFLVAGISIYISYQTLSKEVTAQLSIGVGLLLLFFIYVALRKVGMPKLVFLFLLVMSVSLSYLNIQFYQYLFPAKTILIVYDKKGE
jgi:hypothetical protein